MKRIFILEDDKQAASFLVKGLKEKGYQPILAEDYNHSLLEFVAYEPHLVILTEGSSEFDGLYLSRQIRKISQCPILLIASSHSDMTQVKAIENGADDYLMKPLKVDNVHAKVSRVIQRVYDEEINSPDPDLQLRAMEIIYADKKQSLTRKEFFLMKAFMQHPNKLLTREELLKLLMNSTGDLDDNTLSVNINRLRRKLTQIGLKDAIQTVRGKGYKFSLQ